MMDSWPIPESTVTFSEEIKKSRFITVIGHTHGLAAVKAFLHQTKDRYAGARHYCWACVAGQPDDSQLLGFSDDGEPSGTAGKPMLAQLQGQKIGEVTAVVVRYFGGIKLGTGGLVKAYGGGVQQALKILPVIQKTPLTEYQLSCDYSQIMAVEALLKQHNGVVVSSDFQATVQLTVALPRAQVSQFKCKLTDFSRGLLHLYSK